MCLHVFVCHGNYVCLSFFACIVFVLMWFMFFGAVTSTDGQHFRSSRLKEVRSADLSIKKLSLPIFGLASYKFKVSVWNPNGVYECQKVNSLLRAADNWLRLLQVNHPDYRFFLSHNSQRR